jgi:hypothetical protein
LKEPTWPDFRAASQVAGELSAITHPNPMNCHRPVCLLLAVLLMGLPGFSAAAQVAPTITRQPTSLSRSLGDKASFNVTATGDAPLSYQWRFQEVDLVSATNRILTLTNLTVAQAGIFTVVVSNAVGTAISEPISLEVDATFRLLADSPVSRAAGYGMSWGDYDGDGFIDLHSAGEASALLYHNEGEGAFVKVGPTNALVKRTYSAGAVGAGCWADYNNDGKLDFYAPTGWGYNESKMLFKGVGLGAFESVFNDPAVLERASSWSAQWADFNRDGRLDLFLANGRDASGGEKATNGFYLGQPDGKFVRWQPEGLVGQTGKSYGSAVSDLNGDGYPDVAVAMRDPARAVLLENVGGTNFQATLLGFLGAGWGSLSVADYDNNGTPDLLSTWTGGASAIFRNDGNGGWEALFGVLPAGQPARAETSTWGDYDNDGWLDLFLPRTNASDVGEDRNDSLWRNNGDGTFTQVFAGSVTSDGFGSSHGAAWGDFDNDGFLDLAVAALGGSDQNRLFRNTGNSNRWLLVNLIGTKSNRSAIGAKVRLTARIRGETRTQYREKGTGAGSGQNDPRVHFGLGDATRIETLDIEWPSGGKQTLSQVAANQILTVTEPDDRHRLQIQLPSLDASGNAFVDLVVLGPVGAEVVLESTRDLRSVEFAEEARVTLDSQGRATVRSYFGHPPNRFFRAVQR